MADEKAIRDWAKQLDLTMRRRGSGYSLYGGHLDGEHRKDFQSLHDVSQYLLQRAQQEADFYRRVCHTGSGPMVIVHGGRR
jgi:hypothetical protein